MTTDASAVPAVMPAGSAFGRLLEDLRAVPVHFLVLASVAAGLVLVGARATPVEYYFGPDDSVQAFIGAMWRLGHLLLILGSRRDRDHGRVDGRVRQCDAAVSEPLAGPVGVEPHLYPGSVTDNVGGGQYRRRRHPIA